MNNKQLTDKQKQIDVFHQHLDECEQCENNPFGLCETGAKLLHRAAGVEYKSRKVTFCNEVQL